MKSWKGKGLTFILTSDLKVFSLLEDLGEFTGKFTQKRKRENSIDRNVRNHFWCDQHN
jgi:hypothetical protein